jgi:trk system potassium uptake protein
LEVCFSNKIFYKLGAYNISTYLLSWLEQGLSMDVVIFGSGHLACHLASTLSKEGGNVTLLDNDSARLEQISQEVDVAVVYGRGTDWQVLEELLEMNPELFIALTRDDETNLVACHIAKSLGFPKTIARVREEFYLDSIRLNFGRLFQVDHLISPELLVAQDIVNGVLSLASLAMENFAHGAIMMRTLVVPEKWGQLNKKLFELKLPDNLMLSLINRQGARSKGAVIFPHGEDHLQAYDEVTFIGQSETVSSLHDWFGFKQKQVRSVVILGGSLVAKHVSNLLIKKGISVKIIEKEYVKCVNLAKELPLVTVVHQDGLSPSFLESEKVQLSDVFIACTRDDQVNIMGALVAKGIGCENTLVSVSDIALKPLLKKLKITGVTSPRLKAENRILSIAHEKSVASAVSLYDNQAEIFEVKVSTSSSLVGIPLRELGPLFPQDFLIVGIQNKGRVMVANGSSVMSPGDTVIVISSPKHQKEIQKIF